VDEMTKDQWGRLSGTYDEDHTFISGADLVSAIGSELRGALPGGDVVELGCGTGLYTRAYAPACRQVLATDVSAPMVESARRALAALPNVSVQLADAVATGLPAGSADAVVAVNLLHIVPDAAAVLAEARRLLRPGGVLVVADATGEGLALRQLFASGWRILRRWGLMRPQKGQQNLGQHSLEALVRAAGFESIEGRLLTGELMNAAFVRAIERGDD
jgi:ubiquinone/menaquinone biosynthesis C-methylase UbiE